VLNRAVVQAVNAPDVAKRFSTQGDEPIGSSPDAFAALVKADVARFAKIIEIAGIPKQ
jgi:tripartite-type tricarboxylate transporter receptor subunit TctC